MSDKENTLDEEFLEDELLEGETQEQKAGDEKENVEEEKSVEETLSEELAKEKDKFLRLFAEFENYKRRTSKERMELFKTAGQEVIVSFVERLLRSMCHAFASCLSRRYFAWYIAASTAVLNVAIPTPEK